MTNVLDAEWEAFLEECALKTACHVWEAEASIHNARCESALDDLWFQEDPARMERYFGSDRLWSLERALIFRRFVSQRQNR